MVKIRIDAEPEYVDGYIKYGHFKGEVELTEEEFKKFQNNPVEAFCEFELSSHLELVVDDYEIGIYGDIDQVNYEVIED